MLRQAQPCLQVLFGVNQRLRIEDVDSPLVSVRPVKNVLLVVVTGDRGLCGGYNNFVLKKVRQRRVYESRTWETQRTVPLQGGAWGLRDLGVPAL